MNQLSSSWDDDDDDEYDNANMEAEDLLGLKSITSPEANDDPFRSKTLQDMEGLTFSSSYEPTTAARSFDDVEEAAALVAYHDPLLLLPPPSPTILDTSACDISRGSIRPPVTARPPRRPKTVLLWTGIAVGGLIVFAVFVTLIVLLAQARKEDDSPVDTTLWTQRLITLHLLGMPELVRDFTLLDSINAVCDDLLFATDTPHEESSASPFCELQMQALQQSFLQLLLQISVNEETSFMITDEWFLQQNQTAWVTELKGIDPFFDSLTNVTLTLLPDYPTVAPSSVPSLAPSTVPSGVPTSAPSTTPSRSPTGAPTQRPTRRPTLAPVTPAPVLAPVLAPTIRAVPVPIAAPNAAFSISPFGRNNSTTTNNNNNTVAPSIALGTMPASNVFLNPATPSATISAPAVSPLP